MMMTIVRPPEQAMRTERPEEAPRAERPNRQGTRAPFRSLADFAIELVHARQ